MEKSLGPLLLSPYFSVVELSLLYTGKDSLHYLARWVFLRVPDSENKCPSCHFNNACVNSVFIAIVFYDCDVPKE